MKTSEQIIEIGGRQFCFVKPTIKTYVEILGHSYEKQFQEIDFAKMLKDGDEYKKFKKLWHQFCNSIFERSFVWKILSAFGYLPKQLRFDSIVMVDIGRVISSFFGWQAATQEPQEKPSETS